MGLTDEEKECMELLEKVRGLTIISTCEFQNSKNRVLYLLLTVIQCTE